MEKLMVVDYYDEGIGELVKRKFREIKDEHHADNKFSNSKKFFENEDPE